MLWSPKEVQHILLLLELPENCLATEKPEELLASQTQVTG